MSGEKSPLSALRQELDSLMKEIGSGKEGALPSGQLTADEDGTVLVKAGAEPANQGSQKLMEALEQGGLKLPEGVERRLESLQKEFTAQIKNLLSEEWTLKPESFSDKEEVKNFYQKIKNQAGQMQEAFAAAGKAETSSGQALQQMNQNLQFMENVNQMFPYLQIPLKTSMESAHGELYVYQKKKGKSM